MKPGPKPELQIVQNLKGNPNKGRKKTSKKTSPGIYSNNRVVIPDHLPPAAVECIEQIRSSMPPEVYCDLDTYALTCFAFAWSEHKAAVIGIGVDGHITISNQGTEAPSAWHRIAREAALVMSKYGSSLGLDPVSREQFELQKEAPSKFNGLMKDRSA